MLSSKTLSDLVAAYQAAKQSDDAFAIKAAEDALSHFSHAEAAMLSMRVHEAMTAKLTGFTVSKA